VNEDRALGRMRAAAAATGEAHLGGLIVSPSPDLAYLTGYDPPPLERATLLVLRPGADPFLIVPELERPLAAASPGGGSIELRAWRDGEDPYAIVADALGVGPVALSDRTWASHVLALQMAAPDRSWVNGTGILGPLRSVKDPDELEALRGAGTSADAAFADIVTTRFTGRSEREVAADLADALRAHGHQQVDFTIVGSGPNGASPHHEPEDRVIAEGDLVVLDFGGVRDGYCSDTTRTVAVGEPRPDQAEVHGVVEAAQRAARDAVRPGIPLEEVDRAARRLIADAGYADRFIHRTGHGIGIEVHEAPDVMEGNATPMVVGMTFSVEPGIYLPGAFGVRIEDIVAVGPDGADAFNTSPRGLTRVA
jgi:Xaa-Pro aminopeptidase